MDPSSSSSLDAAVVLNRAIFDLGIGDLLSSLAGGGHFYNSWALLAAVVATGLSLWRIRSYYYSGSIISENHYYTQCNVDQPSVNVNFNSSTTPAAGLKKATVLLRENTPETTHLRETKPAAAVLAPGDKMEEVLMMDGTKKGKFAAYFSGEEKESVVDEDEDEEESGSTYSELVATWELVDVYKMSDIQMIRKPYPLSPVPHPHVVTGGSVDVRTEMMKWFYEYQDMGVLDGRVVRLWDSCGGMRRKRRTGGASSIGVTSLVC